jgi:arabinofuranan 3-O-arabinosyltransferase
MLRPAHDALRRPRVAAALTLTPSSDRAAVPGGLMIVCLVLTVVNATFVPLFYGRGWVFDSPGIGSVTDFINVWSAGKLVLDGHPALAYDWGIQKHLQIAILGQDYPGNLAWHYPPPFLFVASTLARLPYPVAFVGWVAVSFVPYLIAMRAIVGRPFGLLLAAAFPVVMNNMLVGQNGFLTASLIGGMLFLLPTRPVLSGICLGLLSYKPQYGLLFPLVLIATAQWRTFIAAGVTTVAVAALSWIAFGTESWQAFFHWMPMFSQAFLTEGRAPWGKMQSIFALVRYFGGSEPLGWIFQWIMTASVAVLIVLLWRSRVRYEMKAAALATGTLLVTPYLFLYDVMVLAIAVGFIVRVGLAEGFLRYELPALGLAAALILFYPVIGAPTGFGATLLVTALIVARCGVWTARPASSDAGPSNFAAIRSTPN